MSKNIVLCCDGTGNSCDQPDTYSNVVKLYETLVLDDSQIGYYHPGVGTMGSPKARGPIEKHWSRIKGMAFGAGLIDNVADAYRYLMDNYCEGDQIFLFGFSRGAYTARAIASVLKVFGLLRSGNEGLIPYMLRLYGTKSKQAKAGGTAIVPEENFKFAFSAPVDVHFCGVWDTVSSYGWIYSPIELPFEGQNPIIRIGRHAVSIHERRCCYQANLWGPALENQDLRQVWFAGVHSDVGGSYPEATAGLSKITLEWMMLEAQAAGLKINAQRAALILGRDQDRPFAGMPHFVEPNNTTPIPPNNTPTHVSLSGAWWILEYFPRKFWTRKGAYRWGLPRGKWRRQIPAGSWIHQSAVTGLFPPDLPPGCRQEDWRRYITGGGMAA